MQGAMARAAGVYQQTHVRSRSPVELVTMLYDGLLRFLGEAREAIGQNDLVRKREKMSRAMAILAELQNTLNMGEGGEIASSLDALYSYVNGRLLDANMHHTTDGIDEAVRLLTPIRDAWSQLAMPPSVAP